MVAAKLSGNCPGDPNALTALDATKDYLESEDDILSWVTDRCAEEVAVSTSSSELYASWKDWAEKTGRKYGAGSQKAFSQALQDKGYQRDKTRKGAVFFGLRVISRPSEELDL